MKQEKGLIIAAGVIMLAAIVFAETVPNVFSPGTVAKSSQVNENFSYLADRLLARTVIEGTIDTSADGDVVKSYIAGFNSYYFHWKTIEVPQITMTNMPMVWVYMKAIPNVPDLPATNNWMPLAFGKWFSAGDSVQGRETPSFIIDNGKLYIYYKLRSVAATTNDYIPTTGDYKIVVIK